MKIKGNNVLITGGASGIGSIMGRMALEQGASTLIIWDVNEVNIAATKKKYARYGSVLGYKVDVSDHEAVMSAYAQTVRDCGRVDILINCAGIVTSNSTFDHLTVDEITRTMNINAIAPMYVTLACLPDMLRRNHGHICNITSAGGMLSNPRMSVYSASKWAAIGWSDSMRIELEERKSKVHVTTVAPYYINTGMFDGVQSRIFPILKPEKVAASVLKSIARDKRFNGIPWGFHFIRFFQGIMPTSWFDTIFGEWFGIYHTMDNFTGRKKNEDHGKPAINPVDRKSDSRAA